MSAIYLLIITVISLLFSAFFSGMEIAFISSSKIKIELDNKKGEFSAKILSFFQWKTCMVYCCNAYWKQYSNGYLYLIYYPVNRALFIDIKF
jgi:uncharacterized protein YybS (DUF2232 family)